MIQSMTAFASRSGAAGQAAWDWEIRSVNGRGLDLRLRLPEGVEGVEGLEAAARAALQARLSRGNVSLTLRLSSGGAADLGIDDAQLDRVLRALNHVQERAFDLGVTLGQPNAADVLAQRGVVTHAAEAPDAALAPALLADLQGLLDDFVAARAAEGAALAAVLGAQVDAVAGLIEEASAEAEARRPEAQAALTAALRRVRGDVALDEGRLAQELALLAVRADVTEEIDRLRAHVAAARALMADDKPAGRRLDFLLQEFNREASTLCAKAASPGLTRVGLDLKATIDQMREQVQNVE